ncbi:hypothetical protein TNCV_3372791 [Trichonephila clavipes]|nr:hypothetical protein TNCV_3372791 [Trichonephila clavipes]
MSVRRLASESCFYTREKQEVAFDWLDPAFRLERSRKWLLMGYERKQGSNNYAPSPNIRRGSSKILWASFQWVGKEGWGSGYSCHNEGRKTPRLLKIIHPWSHGLFDKVLDP